MNNIAFSSDPRVALKQYTDVMHRHEWSFMTTEPNEVGRRHTKEQSLLLAAHRHGPKFMAIYVRWQQYAIGQIKAEAERRAQRVATVHWEEQVRTAEDTGDLEFDEFRKLVRSHNWSYANSDNHQERIRGKKSHTLLQMIIAKQGGKYLDYYNYIADQHQY